LRLNKFNETTNEKIASLSGPRTNGANPDGKLNSARCTTHQLMIGLKTRRTDNNTIEITVTDGVRPSLADRLAFDYTTKTNNENEP
jgi:hypothetical protein